MVRAVNSINSGADTQKKGVAATPGGVMSLSSPVDLVGSVDLGPWMWQNATRWYRAWIAPDLWGQWQLHQAWGSRRNGLGRYRIVAQSDLSTAVRNAQALARKRQRRGYALLNAQQEIPQCVGKEC